MTCPSAQGELGSVPAHKPTPCSNCLSLFVSVSRLHFPKGEISSLHHPWRWGVVLPLHPAVPQEVACSREGPGSSYLRDELEEGVGVEGSNRQSYEVEQEPLVKSLLHEGPFPPPSPHLNLPAEDSPLTWTDREPTMTFSSTTGVFPSSSPLQC